MTARPAPNPPVGDNMIYFVLCDYRSGRQWAARDPSNMDRKSTFRDIRSGELPNVVAVLECNPVENICNDVTDDVLPECFAASVAPPLSGQDKIDWQRDHERALRRETV